MPTLDWIGKKAVINHHREVPYRLLRCDNSLSAGDSAAGNLLVQGDNLLALKALLPYYAGKVKCIYIDPPYNTGNESWVYNDAVNSPEMRQWLGKVVGREAEDLSRHDKWMCMMYPRLSLLREFLSEDGAMFVSIDDNEVGHLRLLLDEIFSYRNFVANVIWQKKFSPANDAKWLSDSHDHILLYAKNKDRWRPKLLERRESAKKNYSNPDNDPRGDWTSVDYTCNKSKDERPNLYFAVVNPNTGEEILPKPTAVWRYNRETHEQNVKNNLIWWGKSGANKVPRMKKFTFDVRQGTVPETIWLHTDVGNTQEARKEVISFNPDSPFSTPKPVRLIKRILEIATDDDALVLDSFAGSGTTGHAVLDLNKIDGGNRQFILVEMETNICRDVTAKRLERVIKGHGNQSALGSGFRYCTLAEPLFDDKGNIHEKVMFADLAAHVFFTETGQPIPKRATGKTPLLGVYNGTAVYLLYNGVLGDKQPSGGNVLTGEVLSKLPPHNGVKMVYGTACRISPQRLKRENIIFRQTPYEIRTR
jgi:site-specific DNA-methyltransferase (adenine-specific)/adenine-specific DNA-methyltransferase